MFVFKMKELYSLCQNVQDIDKGMCKSSQYEVQIKCAMYSILFYLLVILKYLRYTFLLP